ncbi:hypothetical protein UY3_06966 [Chelonia mydas]|uniref:Uncharacterized protein n=1 Tax=Chelonia mydas TaxID=8469 RepID=M7C5S8_CHEMY|nr:hypothetical protein UY3_06966 [Chelonia mydas]
MRRSSTDESTYHRSPSLDSKDYSFPNGAFRRYSSMYGGQFGAASNSFFGFHTNPGPKATKAKYTSPKGNKYVVFYLDLSFIFLLELKRCSMAHNCLQCIKYLMFVFNLLFWHINSSSINQFYHQKAARAFGVREMRRMNCTDTTWTP